MTIDISGLRILGFCDQFTEDPGGGAEIVAMQVYTRLLAAGANVTVIAATPGEPPGYRTVHGVPTLFVRTRDLTGTIGAQVTFAPKTYRAARGVIASFKPDVLHASSIHFQTSLFAALVARRAGLPLVTTAHVGSMNELRGVTGLATRAYEELVGRMIIHASGRVIAVADNVARHVEKLGGRKERIIVVGNGVDHLKFRPQPKAENPKTIVFIGRLIANKGPMIALKAFSRMRREDAEMIFAGDGPQRGMLEAEVERLGVSDRIRFVGNVANVHEFLGPATLMVRPSLTEGQSLAILEAMAAGICVVASDIPANRDLIEPGVSGLLFEPNNIDDLAEGLDRLMAHEDLCARLAAEGHERSLRYSWDRCARETGQVLALVAGRSDE